MFPLRNVRSARCKKCPGETALKFNINKHVICVHSCRSRKPFRVTRTIVAVAVVVVRTTKRQCHCNLADDNDRIIIPGTNQSQCLSFEQDSNKSGHNISGVQGPNRQRSVTRFLSFAKLLHSSDLSPEQRPLQWQIGLWTFYDLKFVHILLQFIVFSTLPIGQTVIYVALITGPQMHEKRKCNRN